MKKNIMTMVTAGALALALIGCQARTLAKGEALPNDTKTSVQSVEQNADQATIQFPSARDTSKLFDSDDFDASYEVSGTTIDLSNLKIGEHDGYSVAEDAVTFTKGGTYILQGEMKEKQIRIDAKGEKVQIVLNGVQIKNTDLAAIYVKNSEKTILTLAKGKDNVLSTSGDLSKKDSNIDATIFAESILTINGDGQLSVGSANSAIASTKDLRVTGGKIQANATSHSLKAANELSIADGEFVLKAGKDALHSENEENADLGNIYIKDGTFSIRVEGEALDAIGNITIDGGTIDIVQSDEGMEAESIDINGGKISVISSDDGLNASYTDKKEILAALSGETVQTDANDPNASVAESAYIQITGGELKINSNTDGMDSNGSVYIRGGKVEILGPTSDGDSILDYDLNGVITGGELIGSGSAAMLQGFGQYSTQAAISASFPSTVTGKIVVKDSNGNKVLEATRDKEMRAVLISSKLLKTGETYTIEADGQNVSATATLGSMGRGGGNGIGQPPTGQPPTGQPPAGQPPTGQPPTGQPPAGQLPTGQPPAGQPPAGQPPTGQPPTKPNHSTGKGGEQQNVEKSDSTQKPNEKSKPDNQTKKTKTANITNDTIKKNASVKKTKRTSNSGSGVQTQESGQKRSTKVCGSDTLVQ